MSQPKHQPANGRGAHSMPQAHKRTRPKRRFLFALALVLASAAIGVSVWHTFFTGESALTSAAGSALPFPAVPTATPAPTPEPTPVVEVVHFAAAGDDLIHSRIYQQAARNAQNGAAYDFSSCYENVASFFEGFDVDWINQESLVNSELAPSTYPCFSTPGECAEALYNIGFRVFSLSNNHSYDKGTAGIAATQRFWVSMPSDVVTTGFWSGESDYDRIPMQQINGMTIAYLSYTEQTNGIRIADDAPATIIYTSQTDIIQRQVMLAAQQADFVVVGVHWGVEYSHTTSDAQKALAQQLSDWGADVIIGTHPHVIQNAEWLTAADGSQTFVAYSLGNFISTQSQADTMVGAVLTFDLQKTMQPDGTAQYAVLSPKLHPVVTQYDSNVHNITTYLYRDYTPEMAEKHGVRLKDSKFSYDYITQMIQDVISPEFLDIT